MLAPCRSTHVRELPQSSSSSLFHPSVPTCFRSCKFLASLNRAAVAPSFLPHPLYLHRSIIITFSFMYISRIQHPQLVSITTSTYNLRARRVCRLPEVIYTPLPHCIALRIMSPLSNGHSYASFTFFLCHHRIAALLLPLYVSFAITRMPD